MVNDYLQKWRFTMKKYPNSVIKGLLTALLFVMVTVTVFGFLVTVTAIAGEVYGTPKEEVWSEVGDNLYRNFRNWAIYEQVVSIVSDALNLVYLLRYAAPVITIAGFALTVLLFCLLIRAAGHKNGAQEITLSKFDRMPFEIAAGLMIGIPVFLHLLVYELVGSTLLGNWFFSADPVELSVFALLLSPFVYALCHTLAVRIKAKTLWTSTLIYLFCKNIPGRIFHSLKNAGHSELRWYDRIPLELILLAMLPFGLLILYITDILLDGFFSDLPALVFLVLGGAVMLYALVYLIIVRQRLGILWTNTLTYRFGKLLKFLFHRLNHAGRRNESGELVPQWYDRIPLEIVLFTIFLLVLLTLYIADSLQHYLWNDFISPLLLLIYGAAILYGLAYLISVRIQLGTLWKNTLVYRIFRKCADTFPRIFRSIPLTWRTGLAVVLYMFITFLILAFSVDPRDIAFALILWFPMTLAIGALLIYGSWATHTITQILRDMAGGNIHKKTDTSNLFFIFRKQAESLNSLGDGLQAAVQAQMKSERLKTELITNVSHDIKTPLTSIINYADLIEKEQCDNPTITEYAGVLHRQSDRLKRLIEDLVEASKASTGNLEVLLEPCEVGVMLTQTAGEYEHKLQEKDLVLFTSQPEQPIKIMADGRRLWRVFDNLMNNVCKYAQRSTRVYLTLEEKNGQAIIAFKNISREPLNLSADELMERFVQGDTSRKSEGNGLGLSIAKSLTELQNGTMELTTDGDLFKVVLRFPTIS